MRAPRAMPTFAPTESPPPDTRVFELPAALAEDDVGVWVIVVCDVLVIDVMTGDMPIAVPADMGTVTAV